MTEVCLRQAGRSFLLGKLNQCTSLLNSLPLIEIQKSVMLQWLQENNLIICKEDSIEISSTNSTQPRLTEIKSVLKKIRGLPASSKLASLELALTYNHAVLTFEADGGRQDIVDIKERIQFLEKDLLLCLQRCRATQGDMQSCSELNIEELFSTIITKSLQSDSIISLTLLCCIASIYYLVDGNTERALSLLEIAANVEANSQQENQNGMSLLMKLPYQNLTVTLSNNKPGASFQLASLIHLLKACCYFHDEKYSSCLQLLQTEKKDLPSHMVSTWEYIKGYCLFQEGSYNEAAQGLHSLITSSDTCWDAAIKARCNNLIGCSLAKQDRPNSAIQKFREALQEDFSYLEPLYNLSLVYRQIGLCDAELESLNLLATALENTAAERDDTLSDVTSVNGPIMQLSVGVAQTIPSKQQRENINLIHALYTLAKRCLEMQRYSVAAEKYLDLLAVLEDSDVLLQLPSRHCPDGTFVLPSAEVVYLEAALVLCKAEKSEDAIMLCDQILSKCSPASVSTLTSSRNQSDVVSARLSGEDSTMSQDSLVANAREHVTDNNKVQGTHVLDSGEMSTMTRKRQRDEDTEEGQSDDGNSIFFASLCQTELEQLHLFCSALLLKSQCYRQAKQFSEVTKLLDQLLDLLKGVSCVGCVKDSSDVGGPSDSDATIMCGPQLKKRRLDTDEKALHCDNTTLKNEPIRSSLLEIKAQACSDKALVLIGQGKLQDAMKLLLKSVECQSDNQDALYNYTLLLFKMGRRQDAVVAMDRLRTVIGTCDSRIKNLQKTLNVK